MQINACRKSTIYQNLNFYYAAILDFKIYVFIFPTEWFKFKVILIQVYAIKLILRKLTYLEITIDK